MRFVSRAVQPAVLEAARSFPAVVVTGPRRTGKTTMLRRLFPRTNYVLLEDPDVQARGRSDPRALIEELRVPVLFDEIQNAPDLLAYIRTRVDREPRVAGQWLLTGSQEAPLMRGVSESMPGRAAILQLLPFSLAETDRVSLLHGGYSEVLARPRGRTFLAMLASRHGQILNKTDLAAPLGASVPTIGVWLHVLEITGQIPPYYEDFGKRLIWPRRSLRARRTRAGARNCIIFAINRGWRWISSFRPATALSGWWRREPPRPSCRPWPDHWGPCGAPWAATGGCG